MSETLLLSHNPVTPTGECMCVDASCLQRQAQRRKERDEKCCPNNEGWKSRSGQNRHGEAEFPNERPGKARTGILLWLLGVPTPLVIPFLPNHQELRRWLTFFEMREERAAFFFSSFENRGTTTSFLNFLRSS